MKDNTILNREANFRSLEKREWYLWWLALLIILIYTTCIIIVAQPEMWKTVVRNSAGSTFLILLIGLFVLTVLLCSYIIYQETTIKKIRRQFIKDERIKTIGIFAAKVAHELNNNLTVAHGYTELMLDSDLSGESKKDLVSIQNSLNEMTHLICDLLVFCQTMRLNVSQFTLIDLNELIKSFLKQFKNEFAKYNITLKAEIPEGNIKVLGDYHQLVEVFSNITTNAIEEMTQKGVAEKEVRVTLTPFENMCEINIFNTGTVIAPQIMDHLFEPFITTKELGKGTGLGLSITKTILEMHKGDIKVRNHPDGVNFTVALPILKD